MVDVHRLEVMSSPDRPTFFGEEDKKRGSGVEAATGQILAEVDRGIL